MKKNSKRITKLIDRIDDLAESLYYANEDGRFEGWHIPENRVPIRHKWKENVPYYAKKPWHKLAEKILKRW